MLNSSRTVLPLAALLTLGIVCCSGTDLSQGEPGSKGLAPSSVEDQPSPDKAAGVLLAQAHVTPTHSVDLWETQPGKVLMVQSFNSAAGETALDLGVLFAEAGSYGALYRKLVQDPQAPLSAELISADEHVHALPIRDAAQPAPSEPPRPERTMAHGATAEAQTLPPSAVPGQTQVLSLSGSGKHATTPDGLGFNCERPADTDGSYCPGWTHPSFFSPDLVPGYFYGFVYGNAIETMYWDAVGTNPQAFSTTDATLRDSFSVNQYIDGAWQQVYSRSLPGGYSCRATAVGTAEYYQGSITGNIVGYGETYRLSFPTLTQLASHPHWVSNEFANDIQGITHTASSWILSRTEYGLSGPQYGVLGAVALSSDLQNHSPNRYYGEAPAWTTAGYTHFGDVAYGDGYIYVSTNKKDNLHGSIGVYDSGLQPLGVVEVNPTHGCAWVAYNPKTGQTYFSDGDAAALHRRTLTVRGKVASISAAPEDIVFQNLEATPNGIIDDITGGKVSRHGKLWVFSQNVEQFLVPGTCQRGGCYPPSYSERNRGIIYGIDPYSGFVQTRLDVTFSYGDEEGEGVDITDETFAGSPGVSGQLHFQTLINAFPGNDRWNLLNFQVSDLERL